MTIARWAACVAAAMVLVAGRASAEPVKVGLLLPYSSVYASLGEDITEGLALAIETFGAEAGREIVLVPEDTEVKPSVALAKARKLIYQDKVDLLVGPVASNVAGALRDFVDGVGMPLIIPNAGNDDLTGERCSRWVLRTSFSNSQVNRGMGPWLRAKGFETAYLMAADYAAGHQMVDAFRLAFEEAGGRIVGEDYPPLAETKDFAPYLAKARAAEPDLLYVFFAGGPAVQFVKQFDAFGLRDDLQLAGAGWLTSPLQLPAQGEAAVGFIGALNYVPSIDTPINYAFQEAFQARTGRIGSEYAVQGYDTGRLIVEALKATNGATDDKAALVDAMRAVHFEGPRGRLEIDPATNNIVQDIFIFETRLVDGAVRQVVVDTLPAVRDPANGCAMDAR